MKRVIQICLVVAAVVVTNTALAATEFNNASVSWKWIDSDGKASNQDWDIYESFESAEIGETTTCANGYKDTTAGCIRYPLVTVVAFVT